MSRIRATTAPTEEDRRIAVHLEQATRELEEALRIARGARSGGPRARRVERDLGRALHAMSEVSTVGPRYGGETPDPDQMSEDERNRVARERREAARQEALRVSEEGEG